jgi:hypothetical protein
LSSTARTGYLLPLLADALHLEAAHARLKTGRAGRQYGLAALNRAAVVVCISAWEAYIEELVRESLVALRPAVPPLGSWPALNASVRGLLGRFNTPNADQVRQLFSDALGLPDIHLSWSWRNCTSTQAVQRLAFAMDLRHQLAHGVNPRPLVDNAYSSQLPVFFRRLGSCSDAAVRAHLVDVLGLANPWPL